MTEDEQDEITNKIDSLNRDMNDLQDSTSYLENLIQESQNEIDSNNSSYSEYESERDQLWDSLGS